MTKRPCGCGERGRHKITCTLRDVSKPGYAKVIRTCGCSPQGRHKRTCSLSNVIDIPDDMYDGITDVQTLVHIGYGKPPNVSWYPNRERQQTIENRIAILVKRYKPFYLTTTSLDTDEEETWYIDAGNYAVVSKGLRKGIAVGHIKNCLEFLQGRRPLWYNI